MRRLPLTLLLHTASHGRHYDLLVLDPTAPDDAEHRLWAARLGLPATRWADRQRMRLTPLARHRVRYLTYEGPLGRDRGHVRRVDQGHAWARLWTPRRIVLDVAMRGIPGSLRAGLPGCLPGCLRGSFRGSFRGRLTLTHHGPGCWHAVAQRGLVGGAAMR